MYLSVTGMGFGEVRDDRARVPLGKSGGDVSRIEREEWRRE